MARILWALWPTMMASPNQWPTFWRYKSLTLASLISIGLAFTAATFPGEWMDEHIGKKQWIAPNAITVSLGAEGWFSFHDLLFNGPVNLTRQRMSPFSNTLVLPGFDAPKAAKIGNPKRSTTTGSNICWSCADGISKAQS
jgi:hypothetical protein